MSNRKNSGIQPNSETATINSTTRRVVRQYFEKQARSFEDQSGNEITSTAKLFSEDVDFYVPGDLEQVPWIGRRKGRTGVANFLRDLRDWIEPLYFNVRTIVAEGEEAVALGALESRVKSTGKVIKSEFAFTFTVHDAQITRFRLFEDSFAVAKAVSE